MSAFHRIRVTDAVAPRYTFRQLAPHELANRLHVAREFGCDHVGNGNNAIARSAFLSSGQVQVEYSPSDKGSKVSVGTRIRLTADQAFPWTRNRHQRSEVSGSRSGNHPLDRVS